MQSNIKLLITTGIYPPDIGGPATYVKHIAKDLVAHGFDIKVIAYGEKSEKKKEEGYELIRIARNGGALIRYAKFFLAALKQARKHDLIYVQGPMSEGLPTFLAAKITRTPYIMKIVGDYAWEQGRARCNLGVPLDAFQIMRVHGKMAIWRMLQRRATKAAVEVITPSKYLKKIVGMWGIAPEKIQVIYNAIDLPKITETKEALRKKLQMSGFVMLFVGRFTEWKGLEPLVDITEQLHRTYQDLSLLLIGDGPRRAALDALIQKHHAQECVRILPPQPHSVIMEYIRAADVFVLNSEYEGLAHVLIETALIGTPAIVSDAGGNPEIIVHEKNGLVFKTGDTDGLMNAMKRAYEGGTVWKTKGVAEHFMYSYMIDDLVKTLKSVYARHHA